MTSCNCSSFNSNTEYSVPKCNLESHRAFNNNFTKCLTKSSIIYCWHSVSSYSLPRVRQQLFEVTGSEEALTIKLNSNAEYPRVFIEWDK